LCDNLYGIISEAWLGFFNWEEEESAL
jgi:hypothetical protein